MSKENFIKFENYHSLYAKMYLSHLINTEVMVTCNMHAFWWVNKSTFLVTEFRYELPMMITNDDNKTIFFFKLQNVSFLKAYFC